MTELNFILKKVLEYKDFQVYEFGCITGILIGSLGDWNEAM